MRHGGKGTHSLVVKQTKVRTPMQKTGICIDMSGLQSDARSASGHETLDTSKYPWCSELLYLKKKGPMHS